MANSFVVGKLRISLALVHTLGAVMITHAWNSRCFVEMSLQRLDCCDGIIGATHADFATTAAWLIGA